eukprot:TRINITY_DN4136_c0_g1_i1.p3 TRINITY_DN4136_c0_g1~~TRINITY_DN4136_c0_g1_i1.p3  ORF type:complete len:104 (-),score=20.46 TRINITY_DN4136_c0_g1_i1:390-701(-)
MPSLVGSEMCIRDRVSTQSTWENKLYINQYQNQKNQKQQIQKWKNQNIVPNVKFVMFILKTHKDQGSMKCMKILDMKRSICAIDALIQFIKDFPQIIAFAFKE